MSPSHVASSSNRAEDVTTAAAADVLPHRHAARDPALASYLGLDSDEPSSSFLNGLIGLDVLSEDTVQHEFPSVLKAKRKPKQPATGSSTADRREATGISSTRKSKDVKANPKKRAKTKVATDADEGVQPLRAGVTLTGAHVASQLVTSATSLDTTDHSHILDAQRSLFQAPTSVDALRATDGHGCIIYDSSQIASSGHREWTRPIMNEHAGFKRTHLRIDNDDELADFFDYSDDLDTDDVRMLESHIEVPAVTDATERSRATPTHELAMPPATDALVATNIDGPYDGNDMSTLEDDDVFMDVDDLLDEVYAADYRGDTTAMPSYIQPQSNAFQVHSTDKQQPSTDEVDIDLEQARDPIVRPSFPVPARDRSPVIGLSTVALLRTCFRLGEALNVGCEAIRANRSVLLDVYARVKTSYRDDHVQHFLFCDLFSDRAQTVHGTWEQWKRIDLWERDSRVFLRSSSQRMCRCIGTMKKESNQWKIAILNIWEVSWNDVDYVKGIICA